MDVQANVKDALADRGLSEAEIAIRDAEPIVPGEGTNCFKGFYALLRLCFSGVELNAALMVAFGSKYTNHDGTFTETSCCWVGYICICIHYRCNRH